MAQPKPIVVERHKRPAPGDISWIAAPPVNPVLGTIRQADKERARVALLAKAQEDGFAPEQIELSWIVLEAGFGWVGMVREG